MTAPIEPGLYRHPKSGGLYRVLYAARRVAFGEFQAAGRMGYALDATDPSCAAPPNAWALVGIGILRTGEMVAFCEEWKDPIGAVVVYIGAEDGQRWVRDLAQFTERVTVNGRERGFDVVPRFERVGP